MNIRLCGLAAAALTLPTTAVATVVPATIRVESPSATVLPATTIALDDSAGTISVADTLDTDTVNVPAGSAFAQLAAATTRAGMILGFQKFDFGPMVQRIGPATATTTAFWRFKVNGRAADVGASDYVVAPGDRISWALVTDWEAPELAVTPSADTVRVGQSFRVTVTRVDNTGAATPAAGATVTYGTVSATVASDGAVEFVATASGTRTVQAVETPASGTVRSPAVAVCSYGADPTVCDLPAAGGVVDTVAPGSQILAPGHGRRVAHLSRIRGIASPDRSDIARVQLAIARRVGTRCAYLTRTGTFTAPRACRLRGWVGARVSGTNWTYTPPRRLPAGRYRIWSRATDGAGNRESVALGGINAVAVTIAGG